MLEIVKKRYRIWRAVKIYVGVIREAPLPALNRLFAVALIDLALTIITPLVNDMNPLLRLVLTLTIGLVGWFALTLYLTSFAFRLLHLLGKEVASPRRYSLRLAMVSIFASICSFTLFAVFVPQSGRAALGRALLSYAIYVWITISAMLVGQGRSPLRSIWVSLGFLMDNIGKVLVFLIVAVVFSASVGLGLSAAVGIRVGDGSYGVQLLSFLTLFAPALSLPLVCVMYVKAEYFPDRVYPPQYLK